MAARPRKAHAREDMADDIKQVARQQMQQNGTAGISLRGIARVLDVTAPAIYNYFPSLDDLITALLVDAFNAFADAIQAAATAHTHSADQLRAALLAYRQWAVSNVTAFELIYGNPIPGYSAPSAITVPLATRPLYLFGEIIAEGQQTGIFTLSTHDTAPPSIVHEHLTHMIAENAILADASVVYAVIAYWTRIHGMVMLEIFNHTPPSVGDAAAFYAHEVERILKELHKS